MTEQKTITSYDKDLFKKLSEEYDEICTEEQKKGSLRYTGEKLNSNTRIHGKCARPGCCQEFDKNFRDLSINKSLYCKSCTTKVSRERCRQTMLTNHGVEVPFKSSKIREKARQTMLTNHGVENPFELSKFQEKGKQTMLKKYGAEHCMHIPELRAKIESTSLKNNGVKNPFESNKFQEKARQSMIKNHGVENCMYKPEIKQKVQDTMIERYGGKTTLESPELKQQVQDTMTERYGGKTTLESPELKQQVQDTVIERYGVNHVMQNPEISEKAMINCYKSKEYIFPSGKTTFVQGYEHWAIDELIEEGINEQDIIVKRTEIPTCLWISEDGKEHRYFVDIYVKSQNKCIEVKSNWTYEKNIDSVELKLMALKGEGYDCELWIYNPDKTCVKRKI